MPPSAADDAGVLHRVGDAIRDLRQRLRRDPVSIANPAVRHHIQGDLSTLLSDLDRQFGRRYGEGVDVGVAKEAYTALRDALYAALTELGKGTKGRIEGGVDKELLIARLAACQQALMTLRTALNLSAPTRQLSAGTQRATTKTVLSSDERAPQPSGATSTSGTPALPPSFSAARPNDTPVPSGHRDAPLLHAASRSSWALGPTISSDSAVDVELGLREGRDGVYLADLRVQLSDSQEARRLAKDVPVRFVMDELHVVHFDSEAYGHALTAMLFAEPALRMGWRDVRSYAAGKGAQVRFRLSIEQSAGELQQLRWELLQEPETQRGQSLAKSRQVLVSRFIETADLAATQLPQFDELHALIVLANPANLAAFDHAPIPVEAEYQQAVAALQGIRVSSLARAVDGRAVTRGALFSALNEGCHLLYLLCHGVVRDDDTYLWLEDDDGKTAILPSRALVEHIEGLRAAQRPLLVVLAFCSSAGAEYEVDTTLALGPRLARSGVGAVLGFRGLVPFNLTARFLPRFLAQLRASGEVDRAVAIARSELDDSYPWWMPVLFMGLRDGRIWRTNPHPSADTTLTPTAAHSVEPVRQEAATMNTRQPRDETPVPAGAGKDDRFAPPGTQPVPPLWVNGLFAGASLLVGLVWLVNAPGYEPLLAMLGAIGLGATMVRFRHIAQWRWATAFVGLALFVGLCYVWWDGRPSRSETTSLVVRVAKQDGDGIRAAHVVVVSAAGRHEDLTDGLGIAELREVEVTPNSELIIQAPGYQLHSELIDFAKDGTRTIVLESRDADYRSVLLRVVEAERFAPIRNAQLLLVVGADSYSGITDDNGLARFELAFSEASLRAALTITAAEGQYSNRNITLLPEQLQDLRVDTASRTVEVVAP